MGGGGLQTTHSTLLLQRLKNKKKVFYLFIYLSEKKNSVQQSRHTQIDLNLVEFSTISPTSFSHCRI